MKLACVLMQRNETHCLVPWLGYHAQLCGMENLFILDHASTDDAVLATLAGAEAAGAHVLRLAAGADYRRKGEFVSYAMQQAGAAYDFVLPLDCDEFLVMRQEDGHVSCDAARIHAYLAGLPAAETAFLVTENFLNMLGRPELFFALPYRKLFFRGGQSGLVDHGSHELLSPLHLKPYPTRLAYVHFHHKPYKLQRLAILEKLRPFVDVEDPVALAAFRGPGWHLLTHLRKSEAEYAAIMTPDSRCIGLFELVEKFRELGIDPAFAEVT